MRAVMAAVVTNLAASVGGMTWCVLDFRLERKWSTVGFCSGVVAGLVAITPGSGFVPAWSAVVFGVVGSAATNYATKLKYILHIDDALDIFAIHSVGGLVGDLLTGCFAADYIAHLDGYTVIQGGWINRHWVSSHSRIPGNLSCNVQSPRCIFKPHPALKVDELRLTESSDPTCHSTRGCRYRFRLLLWRKLYYLICSKLCSRISPQSF